MPGSGLGSGAAKRGREGDGGGESLVKSEGSASKRHAGGAGGSGGEEVKATIAKIRMRNFLAYEDVEVEPGPELNLIVGPNGSGKSTIVAAICMGLGGSIKIMDRSSEGGFVRRGQDHGSVEIWLNQKGGEMHIRRDISHSGSSTYHMNGKAKNKSDVTKFTRDNNIMLDNLCHFMPQEKVQTFSTTAGKPEEMLEQVQKAVCPEAMLKLHQDLKEEQKKGSTILSDHEAASKLLKEQKEKEAKLADEVERFEKLVELEEQLRLHNKKLPWIKRSIVKEKKVAAHKEHDEALKVLQEKQSELEAKAAVLKEKEAVEQKAKAAIGKYHSEAEKHTLQIVKIEDYDQELCGKEGDLNAALKDIDTKVKRQALNVQKKERECEELREKIAKAGPPPKDIEKKIRDAVDESKKVNEELNNVKAEMRTKDDECKQVQNELANLNKRLNSFRDPRQIKLQALGSSNATLPLKLVRQWLDDNRDKFDSTVYGPVSLELEVDDPLDGEMVAAAVKRHLNAFVVQSRKDFDRLHHLMEQDKELRKHSGNIEVIDSSHCPAWQPIKDNLQPLKAHGVEGYLIDRVRGPKPVMNALCELVQLQRALVGSQKVWDDCYSLVDKPELITKGNDNKKRHKICGSGCFVPGKGRVNITYSFYGTQQGNASQAPFFHNLRERVVPSVGANKTDIENKCKELEARLEKATNERDKIKIKDTELSRRKAQAVEKVQSLKEERTGAASYQAKLKVSEKMLEDEKKRDYAKDKDKLTKSRDNIINQRMTNVGQIVGLASKSFLARKDGLLSELRSMTILSEVQLVRDEVSALRAKWRDAKDAFDRCKRELDKLIVDWEEAKSKCEKPTPEEKEIFEHQITSDLDEIEQKILVLQDDTARLGVANNRLRELEQCRAQIKSLQEKVGDGADVMKMHKQKMQAMKDKWLDGENGEPGLRKMIETVDGAFSKMFLEMGNAGQVKLNEAKLPDGEDDFIHYSLEILVMFRNAEVGGGKMNPLNDKLQSGGERSVSIMLFLVALQQMTQCPFRVVDEINQGMDIHNEKWVFDYVVEHNCKRHKSQFFLITPKLQANLLQEMKDHITILCVFKGKHMLESGDWVKHGMLAPP